MLCIISHNKCYSVHLTRKITLRTLEHRTRITNFSGSLNVLQMFNFFKLHCHSQLDNNLGT